MNIDWKAKEGEKIFYQKFRKQFSLRIKLWRGKDWAAIYNLKRITKVIDGLAREHPEEIEAYFWEIFKEWYDWMFIYYLWLKIKKNKNISLCYQYAKHDWHDSMYNTWPQEDYLSYYEFDNHTPTSIHNNYELT